VVKRKKSIGLHLKPSRERQYGKELSSRLTSQQALVCRWGFMMEVVERWRYGNEEGCKKEPKKERARCVLGNCVCQNVLY
jgi:hypothetical protein